MTTTSPLDICALILERSSIAAFVPSTSLPLLKLNLIIGFLPILSLDHSL